MFLPFIMEYEGPPNSKPIETRVKTIRTFELFDYIYLFNENELMKFKVELNHMDIVDALEKYINTQNLCRKEIMSEKDAKKTKIPLKFLYYLGKYRLENNILKTKNYLVPKQTEFLNLLTEKYEEEVVVRTDLYILFKAKNNAIEDEDDFKLRLIDGLFDNINIEFVDKYVITEKEIDNTIINIRTLLGTKYADDVLRKLRWMLESTIDNKRYITALGLQEKFDKAMNKDKVKVK